MQIRDMTYGGVKMPDVRVVHGSNMILLTDWHIEGVLPDGRVLYIDVKAGFVFDGASIPRALWRVCGHPLEAPRIAAALVHDWIYASKCVSRADADLIYRTICAWVGIRAICRNVEYATLRMLGWVAWNGHAEWDRAFALAHGALELEPKKREPEMKRLMMAFAAGAAILSMSGCKSIEVERHAARLATIRNADGTVSVVRDSANNPVVLDGGWMVDYFQHWNWQMFDSLSAKAGGDVSLDINNYASGADSNLVSLVDTSITGATKLIATAAEAYVKVAGGAQADTALVAGQKIYEYFKSKGGDVSKATVSTDAVSNVVKVTDGATTIQCDEAGNCSPCTDGSCAPATGASAAGTSDGV